MARRYGSELAGTPAGRDEGLRFWFGGTVMATQFQGKDVSRKVGMLAVVLSILIFSGSVSAATTLSGIIKDASGQSVSGAIVKVSGSDTGLSYMVVSQAEGRYHTPELLPGRYLVQALAGGHQSEPEPVEVGSNEAARLDKVLSTTRVVSPRAKLMTNTDYAQLMPAGDGKGLIIATCTRCHGLDRVVPARKSAESWQITLGRMGYFLEDRSDLRIPLSSQEKQTILSYLTKNFTRDTARIPEPKPVQNQHLPVTLLQGAEAKFVVMEFDPGTDADRLELGIDSTGHPWISEGSKPFFGWFDPDTLKYNRIETPSGLHARDLGQIAVDPEGLVWVLDNGPSPDAELISYNPRNQQFKTYALPLQPGMPQGYAAPLNTLRFLDGNVWGTGNVSSRVVKLDPRTGEVTQFPVKRGSHPYGIAVTDKAVWYITNYNNEIIRLDPDTGKQTPYQPPTRKSGLRRMGADGLGNLWAGGQDSNKLVKLDSRTGKLTEYSVPTENSGPYSVDVDTTGNLVWFSERDTDRIGRFDPRTESFIEFPLLTAGIEARRIFVDPVNPNRVWWGCASSIDRFGYIEIFE